MRLLKPLLFLISTIMMTLACGVNDLFPATSLNTPTAALTVISPVTPRQAHTPFPTPNLFFSTPQVLQFPTWTTVFSDPILVKAHGQKPDLQDDFKGLNQGWFYFIPDNRGGPFYAEIQDEALLIRRLAENETRDYWVYNPKLIRKDFVLSFDFRFGETQPEDMARFEFNQTVDQSVALDLSKNQTWTLHWGTHANWQSTTGAYKYFAPEGINILIIMHGKECAVYLNDVPLTYLSDCRSGSIARSSPRAVTFHILAEPGHIAAATIDNLKLWDLDKMTGLP